MQNTRERSVKEWMTSDPVTITSSATLPDAFWLKIYPLALGTGKRLFADGTILAAFKLTDSKISAKGVIIANYERAGEVKTGSFAE